MLLTKKKQVILLSGLAIVLFVVLPAFLSNYLLDILTKFIILALFAVSYDIIYGHTGLLSLGHAAFFGTGGYVIGILNLHYNNNLFWIGMPLAIIISIIVSALFGFISLRVSGLYFLLITFALGQLLYSVTWNFKWLSTPGMQGISGLVWPDIGISNFKWSNLTFYYLVIFIFSISLYVIYRILYSNFGYALRGIRENEKKMQTLGYNVWFFKYIAFIITGGFSGISGALYAYYNGFISPQHVGVSMSFIPMIMVIIGGSGKFIGPIIGSLIYVFAEYFISLITPERWPLILGILFVAVIMTGKGGISEIFGKLGVKIKI